MELAKMPQVSVVRLHTVSSTEYLENGSCCSAGQTKAGLLPCYTRDSGHAATSRPLYLKGWRNCKADEASFDPAGHGHVMGWYSSDSLGPSQIDSRC